MTDERPIAELDYCYLTTTGRHTGLPHRVEIWFGRGPDALYLLSGGGDRSDWVKNLMISPEVVVEVGNQRRTANARVVRDAEEDALARGIVVNKYRPRHHGDLTDWGRTALPVAIDWPSIEASGERPTA